MKLGNEGDIDKYQRGLPVCGAAVWLIFAKKTKRFSQFVWRLRNKSVNLQANFIIGDTIMNTISVDSNIYRGAELYANWTDGGKVSVEVSGTNCS